MIIVDKLTCDLCGTCVAVCAVDAMRLRATTLDIFDTCIDCEICINVCPVNCLTLEEPTHV